MKYFLDVQMAHQPDYTSCGPTCLQALYQYYQDPISLETLLQEIAQYEDGGGTFAVVLANHALNRGYEVSILSFNIQVFDPSWFSLSPKMMIEKLSLRKNKKKITKKEIMVLDHYIEFFKRGGKIEFQDLSVDVIKNLLHSNTPMIAGLSSTWLYRAEREDSVLNESDPTFGDPCGHFVVLHGINEKQFDVADPYGKNPLTQSHYYSIDQDRILNSILLGITTYDGNLLYIRKKNR